MNKPTNKKLSFSILFIIQKGKVKASGRAPIMARITINGEMVHFSTKLEILPDRWIANEYRSIGATKEEKQINLMLEELRALVKRRYHELLQSGATLTANRLKSFVFSLEEKKSLSLLALCDRFNEDYHQLVISGSVTHCTYQRYVLLKNRLSDYMRWKYKCNDIELENLNHSFIKGFDLWLRAEHKSCNNTAAKFIKHFRTVYNMALHNAWVTADPFAGYKIVIEKTDRGYLTQKELQKLISKEIPSKRLELVRDMFIFSCYTGFAFVDVQQLTQKNLQDRDGILWIVTKRQKTNIPVHIRLLDTPRVIIEKYVGEGKKGRLLPLPSNQKTNDYLKEIAAICGIEKNLTYHLARHTFATTITLANGVPIETVSKMLGHTSIKTTQIYARITDMKISNDMEALSQKLHAAIIAP